MGRPRRGEADRVRELEVARLRNFEAARVRELEFVVPFSVGASFSSSGP